MALMLIAEKNCYLRFLTSWCDQQLLDFNHFEMTTGMA